MDSSSGGDSSSPVSSSPKLSHGEDSGRYHPPQRRRRFRPLYEKRIALFAILAALPGVAFGTVLIWTHDWSAGHQDLPHGTGAFSLAGADAGIARPDRPPVANPDQRCRRAARRGLFLSRARGRTQRLHGRVGAGDQLARRHPDRTARADDRGDGAAATGGRGNRYAAVYLRSRSRFAADECRR